jgi:hypothetical protein
MSTHAQRLCALARFNIDPPGGIIKDLRWKARDDSWWALVDPDGSGSFSWMWRDSWTGVWKPHAFGPD